jgi:hypothetical protein
VVREVCGVLALGLRYHGSDGIQTFKSASPAVMYTQRGKDGLSKVAIKYKCDVSRPLIALDTTWIELDRRDDAMTTFESWW